MDKAESKRANTARRMDAALLDLLTEKPFDAITVTDVCRRAGVHRSTFYAHYANTTELLGEVRDATMRGFYEHFDHLPFDGDYLSSEYLDAYLRFVEENKAVFAVFLENLHLFDTHGILADMERDMIRHVPGGAALERGRMRYELTFAVSGVTSVVSLWIADGCRESRTELRDVILGCLRR